MKNTARGRKERGRKYSCSLVPGGCRCVRAHPHRVSQGHQSSPCSLWPLRHAALLERLGQLKGPGVRLWQLGKAPFGVHLSTTLPYNSMHGLSQPPALHPWPLDTRLGGGPASPLAQTGPSAVQRLVLPCTQCGSSLLSCTALALRNCKWLYQQLL